MVRTAFRSPANVVDVAHAEDGEDLPHPHPHIAMRTLGMAPASKQYGGEVRAYHDKRWQHEVVRKEGGEDVEELAVDEGSEEVRRHQKKGTNNDPN